MCFFTKFRIKRIVKKIKSMQAQRVHSQPSTAALAKEIKLYYTLAKIYKKLIGHNKFPFASEMVLECYRAAGGIEDIESKYIVGKCLLEEGKFRDALQKEGVFANSSNERQAKQLYEEAHVYLNAATSLDHVQATRLLGLCYIHGWGVPVDQDLGFDHIVKSIEIENSWDKVTQIFSSIGLNKPEFFTALMKHRKS